MRGVTAVLVEVVSDVAHDDTGERFSWEDGAERERVAGSGEEDGKYIARCAI